MQKYNETEVNGTQYTRCNRIQLINPLGDRQVAIFDEETVFQVSEDQQIKRSDGALTIVVDHEKTVTHYETGDTMTLGDLYKWLASAYLQAAMERDAFADAVAEEEGEPEEEGELGDDVGVGGEEEE